MIDERELGFHLLRWLDNWGVDQVVPAMRKWTVDDPDNRAWLYDYFQNSRSQYNFINDIFICGESIPQIRALKKTTAASYTDLNQYESIGNCAEMAGERRLSRIDFDGIRHPVLIIGAEDEQIVPIRFQEETARKIPHSQLIKVSSGGHLPFQKHPELLKIMNNFLDANKGASPTATSEAQAAEKTLTFDTK